jgi:hypothetical protein
LSRQTARGFICTVYKLQRSLLLLMSNIAPVKCKSGQVLRSKKRKIVLNGLLNIKNKAARNSEAESQMKLSQLQAFRGFRQHDV